MREGHLEGSGTGPMTGGRCRGGGGGMGHTATKFGATAWSASDTGTKNVEGTKTEKEGRG